MAARVADFYHTVDHFDACILDEKELEEEGIIFQPSKPVTISCPGEDLWKKFALPPTPPRSPVKSIAEITQQEKTVAERLQLLSDTLDNDVYENCTSLDTINWKTKIIQDCMWNGVDGLKTADVCDDDVEDMYPTPCSSPLLLDYSSSECVDPSTVFPGCSFNDSCSCSSFSDSEEEEIDVVTVDKPTPVGLKRKLSNIETSSTKSRTIAPALKRTRSHPGHVTDAGFHDYTSLMPSPVKSPTPNVVSVKSSSSRNSSVPQSSPPTSRRDRIRYDDLDPESRRATHNVLERKRRNDLKSSFQSLRSAVPTLKSCEKTPKVIILRKAADHIRHLKHESERLIKEKDSLRKKQQDMLKRYVVLTKGRSGQTVKRA